MPHLPDRVPGPGWVAAVRLVGNRYRALDRMRDQSGNAFRVTFPLFGDAVVLSDPAEVKALFTASAQTENVRPNLGRVLGRGSLFALEGQRHRGERKLLTPPFHGRRLAVYEDIVREEARRELALWPEGQELSPMDSFMRITLNVILRAVFGAEGAEFDRLRNLMPRLVELGSRLAPVPIPRGFGGRLGPWARLARLRAEYDEVVGRLIDAAEADPDLGERDDVLAMMLQARYDDGGAMSRNEVADELLALLAAGHETTATTLTWTVERLRRHPTVLTRLAAEVDVGESDALLRAVIAEVQRVRPVIDFVGRTVVADELRLGRWSLPRGTTVMVGIRLMHTDPAVHDHPLEFDPDRYAGTRPDTAAWIPFGGGVRRCIGAAFADMEMRVVLTELLRTFTVEPTTEPDEPIRSRGVANAPAKGGLIVVHRRDRVGREDAAA